MKKMEIKCPKCREVKLEQIGETNFYFCVRCLTTFEIKEDKIINLNNKKEKYELNEFWEK